LRKIMLITLAAAAVLSGGPFASQATATNAALPSLRAAAQASAWPIERVRSVCGISGCAPVFTKRIQKPPRTFTARAVPLVVPGAPAPAPAPAAAAPTAPWPLSLLQRK
jgi:hypothetical protein